MWRLVLRSILTIISNKINKPSISIYLSYFTVQEFTERLFLTNFSLPIDFPGHLVWPKVRGSHFFLPELSTKLCTCKRASFTLSCSESQTYPLYIVFLAASLTTGSLHEAIEKQVRHTWIRICWWQSATVAQSASISTKSIAFWIGRQKDCITFRFPSRAALPHSVLWRYQDLWHPRNHYQGCRRPDLPWCAGLSVSRRTSGDLPPA